MDTVMITTVITASILISFGILKKQKADGQKSNTKQIFSSFCLGIGTAAGMGAAIFSVLFYNRPTTDYVGLLGLGVLGLGLFLISTLSKS